MTDVGPHGSFSEPFAPKSPLWKGVRWVILPMGPLPCTQSCVTPFLPLPNSGAEEGGGL